ncbi:MAG: RNA polymerase sigma factor [Solirubrobacteraceae bacterium]
MGPRRTASHAAPTLDLARLHDEHVWGVYGFFAYHRLPRQDVEDLTQATFERAIRAFSRYDPARANVRTWLVRIAQNVLIDHHRRERFRRHASIDAGFDEALLGSTPGPEDRFELSPALGRAMASLSEREREVIALRIGADLPGPEIAALLDLSVANVHQIASRALRKLREQLDATAGAQGEEETGAPAV